MDVSGSETPCALPKLPVSHAVLAEGDIRDSNVNAVIGDRRVLVSHDVDSGVRVEILDDLPGGGIKLHSGALRPCRHFDGLQPKEAPRARGRLQDARVGQLVASQTSNAIPHG